MALPFLAANLGYKAIRDYVVPLFKKKKRRPNILNPIVSMGKKKVKKNLVPVIVNKKRGASGASADDNSSQKKLKSKTDSSMPKLSVRSRGRAGRALSKFASKLGTSRKRALSVFRAKRGGRRVSKKRRISRGTASDNGVLSRNLRPPPSTRGMIRLVDMDDGTVASTVGRWSPWLEFSINDLQQMQGLFQNSLLTQDASVNTFAQTTAPFISTNAQIISNLGTSLSNFSLNALNTQLSVKKFLLFMEIANVCTSSIVVDMMILRPRQNISVGYGIDILGGGNSHLILNQSAAAAGIPVGSFVTAATDTSSDMFDISNDHNFKKTFTVYGREKFFLGAGDTRRIAKPFQGFTLDAGELMIQTSTTVQSVPSAVGSEIAWIKNRTFIICFRVRGKVTTASVANSATFGPGKLACVLRTEHYTALKAKKNKIVIQQAFGSDIGTALPVAASVASGQAMINDEGDAPMLYQSI